MQKWTEDGRAGADTGNAKGGLLPGSTGGRKVAGTKIVTGNVESLGELR